MSRSKFCRPAFWVFSLIVAFGLLSLPARSGAADGQAVVISPHPKMSRAPQIDGEDYATPPRKDVEYGCKRIWRCDTQVCEWRRGCWGIYGYMEAPYYSLPLAKSQWQSHGWPTPKSYRN